ncbi:A24 family peptidase [Nonomuraea sp. 3-1Str]|uniref:A24 family peptidase n=1 Tax=Nonomuraea sp. 3-1Str TaxID=2929801 RepID=UPI00285C60A9|nr:A24 family peptidase [Nonomuraea sp. 3-1Str]MDR8407883.1 A24 family peptidase [Nonomuraea sp. 3-1Str]
MTRALALVASAVLATSATTTPAAATTVAASATTSAPSPLHALQPTAHTPTGRADQLTGRVALIGVPGLEWSDLDASRTPNLWKLVGRAGSASLSTRAVPPPDRGVTCPLAGWLTVSAGQRAGTAERGCPALPTPQRNGDGATVPGWAALAALQADTGYDAQLGTLGQLVTDGGGRVAAIGPGAALAAANKAGNIATYADTPEALPDPSSYHLIVQDVSPLAEAWSRQPLDEYGVPSPMPTATRRAAVAEADRRIGTLLTRLPSDTTILVAGISDVTPNAHLHVALATGPAPADRPAATNEPTATPPSSDQPSGGEQYRHGHLTATSTRQDALVTITDLTATAIATLGLEPPRQVVGRAWQNDGPAPATPAETVAELADADLASQVLRDVRGPFFAVFVSVQLAFYAFAALALRRRRKSPGTRGQALTTDAAQHPNGPDSSPTLPTPLQATPAARTDTSTRTTPLTGSPAETTPAADVPAAAAPTDSVPAGAAPAAGEPAEGTAADGVPAGATPAADVPAGAAAAGVPSEAGAAGGGPGGGARRDVAGESRLLTTVQVVAVVSGAIAVSTFLAQLVPWWSLPTPMAALILTILGIALLISGVAFAGPWRGHVLGPLTVVAAVTSVALLADVMTGSTLQVNAVTGYEPVTGGRFYGFSNIAFAVYATGTILGLAGVAQWLLGKGAPRIVTLLVCAVYGGLAVFADGWPAWGADFGGVPAFVIGLAVFLIMLSGRRVSIVKLLVVALGGAALIGAIAVFDWLRPATQRTHLGNFVQQIIDGQAWTVVGRKFGAMIGVTVGNWSLTLLSVVALAFLFLVLDRPSRWGASALGQAYALAPALRAGLFGALTCAFIGFLINDSGIAIPAMALTVAVPLSLAASVRALRISGPTTPGPPSEPAASTEPPAASPRP